MPIHFAPFFVCGALLVALTIYVLTGGADYGGGSGLVLVVMILFNALLPVERPRPCTLRQPHPDSRRAVNRVRSLCRYSKVIASIDIGCADTVKLINN
jgi:hypothetical protein